MILGEDVMPHVSFKLAILYSLQPVILPWRKLKFARWYDDAIGHVPLRMLMCIANLTRPNPTAHNEARSRIMSVGTIFVATEWMEGK
jgi:hypothetical protein